MLLGHIVPIPGPPVFPPNLMLRVLQRRTLRIP